MSPPVPYCSLSGVQVEALGAAGAAEADPDDGQFWWNVAVTMIDSGIDEEVRNWWFMENTDDTPEPSEKWSEMAERMAANCQRMREAGSSSNQGESDGEAQWVHPEDGEADPDEVQSPDEPPRPPQGEWCINVLADGKKVPRAS